MKIIQVKYFDKLDWKWVDRQYLAKNENKLKEYINSKILPPRYRGNPCAGKSGHSQDSLTMEVIDDNVELPLIID